MIVKSRIIKSGAQLSAGQAALQASSFARNIILARFIGPADFGIAALLGISLQVLEMLTNVSAETLLIQAEDGDEERMQATAHLYRALRGIGNGALIFVAAGVISQLFGVPQASWAFRCLGLLPAIRGFQHLDTSRLQRHMRFGPQVLVDAGANWMATFVAIPIAVILRSYAAMLWCLIAQVATATVMSHILAERPYRWSWDGTYWRRMVRFGWPLMINGILMFGIFEGDRVIIGSSHRLFPRNTYTLSDLGIYSATFALTMAPTMFVANISSSLFLPLLARVQNAIQQFRRRYAACAQGACLAAALAATIFIACGGSMLKLLYGAKYAGGVSIIGWLGAMWAVRIVRVAPALAGIALGDTKNSMISNCARTLAIAGMLGAAATGAALVWIAISGLAGELLALAVSLWRLRVNNGVEATLCLKPLIIASTGVALTAIVPAGDLLSQIIWSTCCITLVTGAMMLSFRSFREDVLSLFKLRALGLQPGS